MPVAAEDCSRATPLQLRFQFHTPFSIETAEMERWVKKIAVVTGASSGIGAAIAKELVVKGMNVVGVARRVERVQELESGLSGAKGKLYPLKGDITSEADVKRIFEWVRQKFGTLHVLVNNAGLSRSIPMTGGADNASMRLIFETNVFGLFMCTNAALELMKEKGVNDGHIVHISSVAGHQIVPLPGSCIYSASKHAVTVMTEGLRRELVEANSGIRVTSISPGFVMTEIVAASNMKDVEAMMANSPSLDPKEIASAVAYALSVPPNVQIHDIIIKPVGEKL